MDSNSNTDIENEPSSQSQASVHLLGATLGESESTAKCDSKHQCPLEDQQYTGFDAVVKEERKHRKLTFGPNSKKIPKPSNILIDIYGVISSWAFVKELKSFARANMESYIRNNWNSKLMKATVARLREQIPIDCKAGIQVPPIASPTESEQTQIDSVVNSIRWQMEHQHCTTKIQIERLCVDLWSQSYDNGQLKTHAYPDVVDVFNYWRFEEFIKIYSYASGPVEGQRQFLRASTAGDLNRFIANGLNSSGGYKYDPNKFRSVVAALREAKPQNLLYITDDPKKAKNAMQAGMRSVVVNREGSTAGKYAASEMEGLIMVRNLSDIEFIEDSTAPTMTCC